MQPNKHSKTFKTVVVLVVMTNVTINNVEYPKSHIII